MNRAISYANKLASASPEDAALRKRIFDALSGAYLQLLPRLRTAPDCTIPLYACSRAKYWGPASTGGKGGLAVALLQRLSEKECALLWGEWKEQSDQSHSNLWLALAEALKSAEGRQVLSSIDLPRLLEASAVGLLSTRELAPQACSNILLACARLKWRNDRLAHHLTECLLEQGHKAKNQELANAVYALGELAEDVRHMPRPEDLQGLVQEATARLASPRGASTFIPLDYANMLLGCAKLGFKDSALEPLVVAAGQAVHHMSAQEFANTVWAVAKTGLADQGWYASAVKVVEQAGLFAATSPQNWSNLWYALAVVRHRPASGRLLGLTVNAAGALRQGADYQTCANSLWALANLRLYDERLVDALAGRLGELLGQDSKQLTEQGLCNSLWALAVMGPGVLSRYSGLVEGLLREAERRWMEGGRSSLNREQLVQLWQTQLELANVGGGELQRVLGAAERREGSFLSALRMAASSRIHLLASLKPSPLEDEVASALEKLQRRMGPGAIVSVQRRVVVEEVGRFVQVLVELGSGRRVAVEPIALHDVYATPPHDRMLTGSVQLRNRHLEPCFGATDFLSAPYWEWEAPLPGAPKAEDEQLDYLSRLLGLREA
ncbi:hypothetical protein HYH03_004148 [Edaphochlamys debaryana]|uniref:RAP domain-containing protein n=1 Tax=Edaphochlamys debaryana TaxID=47281 RepID=A0A835Y7U9_9CHLO|nr:hypothetical protein HYH03_004148 [Edaphochlamys debaryana]|eukprot:KAG2497882.1 hypothetical protein HYH03_004148 [Edaphochlamys debaryana]